MSARLSGKRVAIIGGGLGGLALAIRLAARGARVTVCEQGDTFGGKMNVRVADGYRFDTGPSLITMPWVFEEAFAAAGAHLHDHVQLQPVLPLARYHFADGTVFDCTASLPAWLTTIRSLEPRDVDGFWRFMALGARIFELSQATFFRSSPWTLPDRTALAALTRIPIRHAWGTYHDTVTAHFKSPHLRQLFDRYPTYVGSSPYAAPATLAVIPYIEHAFGGWHVRGGLYRIVEALLRVAASVGVELWTGARVARIEQRDRTVSAVVLSDGRRLACDVAVMNGDASTAAALLDGGSGAGLPQHDRSLSGFVALLGLRQRTPQLAHHAVYFTADYRREFADLFDRVQFPGQPTVYVSAPGVSDGSLVHPGGGQAIFVMANAPAIGRQWDEAMTREAERRVFDRLAAGGFPDLSRAVAYREVWTPACFEARYGSPGGAIYGSHSHGWRLAFLRPRNRDAAIRGLYYVGGSTHPGGGTPTVLMSARITAALIEAAA